MARRKSVLFIFSIGRESLSTKLDFISALPAILTSTSGHFDLLYPKLGGPELVVNLVSDLYCGTWTYKDDHLDGIPKSVSSNDAASSSAVKNDGIAAREISNDTETLITLSQGRAGLHEQNDSWREYAVQSKIGTLSGAPVKRNISSMNDRIVLLGNRSPV